MVRSSINPILTLDYTIKEMKIRFLIENPHN